VSFLTSTSIRARDPYNFDPALSVSLHVAWGLCQPLAGQTPWKTIFWRQSHENVRSSDGRGAAYRTTVSRQCPPGVLIKLSGNGEKRLNQGEMPFGAGGRTLATGLLRFQVLPLSVPSFSESTPDVIRVVPRLAGGLGHANNDDRAPFNYTIAVDTLTILGIRPGRGDILYSPRRSSMGACV
jgi:hypothetical protein